MAKIIATYVLSYPHFYGIIDQLDARARLADIDRSVLRGGKVMDNPLISKWSIYILPEWGNRANEKLYAQELIQFLDSASVGDKIYFRPKDGGDYTFSLIGEVYGHKRFERGSSIATSSVSSFERIGDDRFGDTYAVQTVNTVYVIHANESRELIRVKAEL